MGVLVAIQRKMICSVMLRTDGVMSKLRLADLSRYALYPSELARDRAF